MKYGIKNHFYCDCNNDRCSFYICHDCPLDPSVRRERDIIWFLTPIIKIFTNDIIVGRRTIEEVKEIMSKFKNGRFKFEVWE